MKIKNLELLTMEEDPNYMVFRCRFVCKRQKLIRRINDGFDIHEVNEFLRLICPEADKLGIIHFYHPEQYRTLLGIILETVKNKLFSWEELTEGGLLYV